MNTSTGRTYDLGSDFTTLLEQEPLIKLDDTSAILGRSLTTDERAAMLDSIRGDTIVPVSGDVAQMMRLGAREKARRRRRARAARQARKRNR